MLNFSKNRSLYISIVISVIFFIICLAGLVILPQLTEMLINTPDNIGNRDSITQTGRVLMLVVAYAIVLTFILADCLLYRVLMQVKKGNVFSVLTVALIRGVSMCCFSLCLLFGILGIYFQLAFIVSFLAVFLGICLRVVKNVIEEATAIKQEHELTV